jgi:uncharacterized membrane protein
MFDSELQTGIAYALLAGTLWGIGPLLVKRALKYTNVSTATLVEQNVSVFLLVGLAGYSGEIAQIDFTRRAFWAFFLAGAVGASFGKVFYYKGIDKVGASKATSVKNSSPFLTAILAMAFVGEAMNGFNSGRSSDRTNFKHHPLQLWRRVAQGQDLFAQCFIGDLTCAAWDLLAIGGNFNCVVSGHVLTPVLALNFRRGGVEVSPKE